MPGTVRLLVQLQHLAPTGVSLNMVGGYQERRGIIHWFQHNGSRKDGKDPVRDSLTSEGWIPHK